jgi:hypothetical protein
MNALRIIPRIETKYAFDSIALLASGGLSPLFEAP